jgi:hypothetical protein
LQRLANSVRLEGFPLIETLSFTAKEPIAIDDVYNDLEREKAFENQAMEAALMARKVCREAKVPFANRDDYRDYAKVTNRSDETLRTMLTNTTLWFMRFRMPVQ